MTPQTCKAILNNIKQIHEKGEFIMDYPMLQPWIEYKTDQYSFEIKEDICSITAYGFYQADKILLVPDGCEELIMSWGFGGKYYARPDKTARTWLEPPAKCTGLCGIRLEPGFTVNMNGNEAEEISSRLASAKSQSEARGMLLGATLPFIEKKYAAPVWEEMTGMVYETRGRCAVAELAAKFGYTARHVGNLFREGAGCPPKTFCRFVRFHNALREMIRCHERENSQFIESLSYADQAHFQREFKEFTGMTPRRFAKEIL